MIGFSMYANAGLNRVNGIVTDTVTKLQWQDDYTTKFGTFNKGSWSKALTYCHNLVLEGAGWRLPNKNELLSIVEYSKYSPSLSPAFKEISIAHYWTSTTANNDTTLLGTGYAWYVEFYHGKRDTTHKNDFNFVRCVRAGLLK